MTPCFVILLNFAALIVHLFIAHVHSLAAGLRSFAVRAAAVERYTAPSEPLRRRCALRVEPKPADWPPDAGASHLATRSSTAPATPAAACAGGCWKDAPPEQYGAGGRRHVARRAQDVGVALAAQRRARPARAVRRSRAQSTRLPGFTARTAVCGGLHGAESAATAVCVFCIRI